MEQVPAAPLTQYAEMAQTSYFCVSWCSMNMAKDLTLNKQKKVNAVIHTDKSQLSTAPKNKLKTLPIKRKKKNKKWNPDNEVRSI